MSRLDYQTGLIQEEGIRRDSSRAAAGSLAQHRVGMLKVYSGIQRLGVPNKPGVA